VIIFPGHAIVAPFIGHSTLKLTTQHFYREIHSHASSDLRMFCFYMMLLERTNDFVTKWSSFGHVPMQSDVVSLAGEKYVHLCSITFLVLLLGFPHLVFGGVEQKCPVGVALDETIVSI
jgi:hypothetical protein